MRLNLYLKSEKEITIKQDLILRAKNTNIINCYFYDEDDALINITDSEIYFMVKTTPSIEDASAILNKKITTFTDPTNGNTEIELTSLETEDLIGNYIYQLKIKYINKFYTIAEGNICFKQSIIAREI